MEFLLIGALLLSAIGTGSKQYAMKKCGAIAPGAYNSIRINMIRAAICLVISFVIWLLTDGYGTNSLGLIISIAAGIGTALNLFTWILSAQRISLTLLEGVCTVGALVVPLFLAPYLYNGESVSLLQWLGTFCVIASLFFFSEKDTKKMKSASLLSGIALLFFCTFGIATASVAKKLYTFYVAADDHGSVSFFTLVGFLTVFAVFLILLPICRQNERRRIEKEEPSKPAPSLRAAWHFILIAAVALYASEFFATYASDLPSAIYYPAIKALNVLGCFLLDVTVFKEKVTVKKAVGLVLLLAAVVLINV